MSTGVTILDENTLKQGPVGQRYLLVFRTDEFGKIEIRSKQDSVPFYYVEPQSGAFDKLGDVNPTYALHQSNDKFATSTSGLMTTELRTIGATKYFGLFAADNNGRIVNNAHNPIFKVSSEGSGAVEKIGTVSTKNAVDSSGGEPMPLQPIVPQYSWWWSYMAPVNVILLHLLQGVVSVIAADYSWRQYCLYVYNPKHSHFDYMMHVIVFFAFVSAYSTVSMLLQRLTDRVVRWLCLGNNQNKDAISGHQQSLSQWMCELNSDVTRELLYYFRIFVYFSFCGVLAMCIFSKPIPELSISFGNLNFATRVPMAGMNSAHIPAMGGSGVGGQDTSKLPPFKSYGGMKP